MKTIVKRYRWWIAKLVSEEPFTFVRYGDGELNAIIWTNRGHGGGRTKNGDGHTLRDKTMRALLIQSIRQPPNDGNYYRSLWLDEKGVPVERLAREHCDRLFPGVTWYNALAIHFKNVEGKNYPYFQAMRNQRRPVVVIGPEHLRGINERGCFDYDGFVSVPYRRAFFERERIVEQALAFPPDTLYSIHAGPPSPVIAHLIWKERGDTCAALDLGSVLDGYVHTRYGGSVEKSAALTRSFWKKRATTAILERNLRGK